EPVPSMYTTSWVKDAAGAPRFLLVMQYNLTDIYNWADRVVSDVPRVDHYRIASDGMFLIGGARFKALEFAANRGLEERKLGDVLPEVWNAVKKQRYGSVETSEGVYLFRSHASDEALHVARNSAYAISILFIPSAALYATSIFAGFQGVALIFIIYLTAAWIAAGFWRQLMSRRALESKDQEVSRALARLEHVTKFGGLGLLEINTVTGTVYANPIFFQMHGKPVPESQCLRTRDIRQMFPGYESLHDHHARAVQRLMKGEKAEALDYDFKLPSGEFRRYRIRVALAEDGEQQLRSRSLYTDITDLYEQQQALIRSGEQQASMFKIIAHELRTPAAATQMIVSELPDEVPEKNELRSTSDHLLHVIDDLRITVNPDELIDSQPVQFDLAVLIQEVERQVRALFSASNMTLEMPFIEPEADRYFADAFRLRAIMTNLLRNAAYHSAGTRAWLSVDVTALDGNKDRLVIRVDDNGRGIREQDVARFFAPFERGDTHVSGTGVGLHIAKTWGELLGGELVYRPSDFGGACFQLTLTVERCGQGVAEALNEPISRPSYDWLAGKRVLLVEDDLLLQKVTERMLSKSYGMTVTLAEDGTKGLRAVEAESFDLIITDFLMPNMDGLDMIAAIRQAGHTIPIIGLTAAMVGGEQDALIAAGANSVLIKPLEPEKFEAAMRVIYDGQ
ncbi:MAG: response regulator, partial [Halieaceae bacterium]|nr:response regulator [Halieaceae bacterium]